MPSTTARPTCRPRSSPSGPRATRSSATRGASSNGSTPRRGRWTAIDAEVSARVESTPSRRAEPASPPPRAPSRRLRAGEDSRAPEPSAVTSARPSDGDRRTSRRSARRSSRRWSATSASSFSARTSASTAARSRSRTACSREFGEERVIDTPISEAAIVGAAVGAAHDGHAAGRRDAVRGLHLLRLRHDHELRREVAVPIGRRRAARRARAVRRRRARRALPLAEPRGLFRPHARPEDRPARRPRTTPRA